MWTHRAAISSHASEEADGSDHHQFLPSIDIFKWVNLFNYIIKINLVKWFEFFSLTSGQKLKPPLIHDMVFSAVHVDCYSFHNYVKVVICSTLRELDDSSPYRCRWKCINYSELVEIICERITCIAYQKIKNKNT